MRNKKITIDLNDERLVLNETVYSKFAGDMERLMWMLYDSGVNIPMNIIGKPSQVDSFMDAIKREKRYMDSYMQNGLNDHKTMNNKYDLESAIKRFELETGLKWPFKN